MTIEKRDGWAVGSLDDMGSGPGFRKVRRELDVTAFGVNAIVLPPHYTSNRHSHERQEELYLVHEGTLEMQFGDGESRTLARGGFARVDPGVVRAVHNPTDEEAVYVCVGGQGGYVGRDGRTAEA